MPVAKVVWPPPVEFLQYHNGTGEVTAVVVLRKAVLYDTTAVPDATQPYVAVVVLRYTRGFSVCCMHDAAVLLYSYVKAVRERYGSNARAPGKLLLNESFSLKSRLGPKNIRR